MSHDIKCGWCGGSLEPSYLVARGKAGEEKPVCAACLRRYKPVVVRLEKE